MKTTTLPNWAKLSLQYDRTVETPPPAAPIDAARPIVERLESELAIANAAICKSRERAEDAERDLVEEQGRVATLTDERNQLQAELDELAGETARADAAEAELAALRAKVADLENAAAIEANRLTAAWRTIREIRERKDAPLATVAAATPTVETPPAKRRQSAKRTPELTTAPRRAVRQVYDLKTGNWQPA